MTERTANQALDSYNQSLYDTKQAWAKVLAKPAKVAERKPVKKQGFLTFIQGFTSFSMFFKG